VPRWTIHGFRRAPAALRARPSRVLLEDAGVPFVEAGESPGAGQFPACAP
jgi:hypothetical protein